MNDAFTIIGFVGGVAGDEGRLRTCSPVVRRHGTVYALSSTTITQNNLHQLSAEDHRFVTLLGTSLPADFGDTCWIAGPEWLDNPDVRAALAAINHDRPGWIVLPGGESVTSGPEAGYTALVTELLAVVTARLHETIRAGDNEAIRTALRAYEGLWLPDDPTRVLNRGAAFTVMGDDYAMRFEEISARIFRRFPTKRAYRQALASHLAGIRAFAAGGSPPA